MASAPLFGSLFFWMFYDNQDVLLLNYFHVPTREIGLFSAAIKIVDVLKVLPVLWTGVFFPRLARASAELPADFSRHGGRLVRDMALGATGMALLLVLLARWIPGILFGAEFAAAGSLLIVLLVAFIGICLNHVLMHILIARDRERQLLIGAVLVCGTNLAGGCLLVPRYGVIGICYALIISEACYLVYQAAVTRRYIPGMLTMAWRA
jgi:O-antigen/teichoic acid export membrane protein